MEVFVIFQISEFSNIDFSSWNSKNSKNIQAVGLHIIFSIYKTFGIINFKIRISGHIFESSLDLSFFTFQKFHEAIFLMELKHFKNIELHN